MQPKMVYLVNRNPLTTVDEFTPNWRQHAALGSKFPELSSAFTGFVQCRAISDVVGATTDFDGVNILSLTSFPAVLDAWESPVAKTEMLADELRVFSAPVHDRSLYAIEHVALNGPKTRYVAVRFVAKRADVPTNMFVRHWAGPNGIKSICDRTSHVRRLVHNCVLFDRPFDYPFDGVEETWFESIEAMQVFFAAPSTRALLESQYSTIIEVERSVLIAAEVIMATPRITDEAALPRPTGGLQ